MQQTTSIQSGYILLGVEYLVIMKQEEMLQFSMDSSGIKEIAHGQT